MPFQVNRTYPGLIQEKDHLAASLRQGRPAAFPHGFVQRTVMPAHLIWRDDLVPGEYRGNLRIGHAFFRLDQNEERDVLWMSFGPGANDLQASDKRLTTAHKIDVLDVHDLEPGLQQDAVWIRNWVGGQPGLCNHCLPQRMGKAATFIVGEDVQLDLPNSVV